MEEAAALKSKRLEASYWALLVVLTLLGLALRQHRILEFNLWTDELNALRTSRDWETVWEQCLQWISSPPTRYVITRFLIHTFFNEYYFRIPSLIAGTLAIPVAAWVARRWWGKAAGLATAGLVALNPWIVVHSQDGRMHAVALFFCLLAVPIAVPPLARWRRFGLVLGGVSLALASSINYQAMLVCAGIATLYLISNFDRKEVFRRPFLVDTACFFGPWALWVIAWFALVLWYAPNSPLFRPAPPPPATVSEAVQTPPLAATVPESASPETALPVVAAPPPLAAGEVDLHTLPPSLTSLSFYLLSLRGPFGDTPLRWLTLLGVFLFCLLPVAPNGPPRLARLSLIAVPLLLAISQKPDQVYPRYGLPLLPFALMGLSQGALFLGRINTVRGILLAGLLVLSAFPTLQNLRYPPQAWTQTLDFVIGQWQPTDRLLVGTHQAEYAVLLYNRGRIPKESIVWRVFMGKRFYRETRESDRRTWLIQWFGFPPVVEEVVGRYYDRVGDFPGRYGNITLYRKKDDLPPVQKPGPEDAEGEGVAEPVSGGNTGDRN